MCDFLRSKQFRAESISGTLTQEVRNRIVKRLKNNSLKILVATDLVRSHQTLLGKKYLSFIG